MLVKSVVNAPPLAFPITTGSIQKAHTCARQKLAARRRRTLSDVDDPSAFAGNTDPDTPAATPVHTGDAANANVFFPETPTNYNCRGQCANGEVRHGRYRGPKIAAQTRLSDYAVTPGGEVSESNRRNEERTSLSHLRTGELLYLEETNITAQAEARGGAASETASNDEQAYPT